MYLDWEKKSGETFVIDIETDSLDATVIYVMCWQNVGTSEKGTCIGHESIAEFFRNHPTGVFVGHNILCFDAPTIVRLVGSRLAVTNCIDTLILSQLYSPSLDGGHSLSSWGEALGREKIEFHDFSRLSDEMIEYCQRDVEITVTLFKRLMKTLTRIGFTELSIWVQHRMTVIIDRQSRRGFYFNQKEAIKLYAELRSLASELEDEIRRVFPAKRVLVAERQMRRKDGVFTAIYEKDRDRYQIEVVSEDTYRAYEDVPFNVGSSGQRVEKLLSLGWQPLEFTDKGNPKPFDKGDLVPSLKAFLEDKDIPEVAMIARWMSYTGRANMINNWLENYNEIDRCIHGKLYVADTLRFRHQSPNTANIPAVRVGKDGRILRAESGYFTYESRDLWCARPGRVLVGTDAAGLELRMLAHYLNRADFTESVVNGDPHQYNADTVGITRPQAKTLIYAVMYGAAAPKIAKTLNVSVKEGGEIRELFLERLGLKELIDSCKAEQRRGRIELVDGSYVTCPSPHAALNYKLQGGGARVMALGSCFLEADIRRSGIDSWKVGDIHDEWQYDCHPDDADDHARKSVEAIIRSGESLRLDVPLDGTAKKGLTWAETH